MVDLKIDIRILILSILIHLGAYGLLNVAQQSSKLLNTEAIEIVINEDPDSHKKQYIPDSLIPKKQEHDLTKPADYLANQTQRVNKQTIAKKLDIPQNQNSVKSPQKQEATSSKTEVGQNLLPIPTQTTSEETRQSSVNFEAPNVAKGDLTFLNADFSTYASFYNRITPKIMYGWSSNIEDIVLFPHMREAIIRKLAWTTRVELILTKTGHFKDIIVAHSSGSPEMDQAVVDALKNSAPYLNPPTGMVENDGHVHIHGQFTVYTQRPRLAH